MLTRAQALERHSPTAWGLIAVAAIAATELLAVVAWNLWDRREQLADQVVRLLHH